MLSIVRHDGSFDEDTLVDTDNIDCGSPLSNPEFLNFCIEAELEEDMTLDQIYAQFINNLEIN